MNDTLWSRGSDSSAELASDFDVSSQLTKVATSFDTSTTTWCDSVPISMDASEIYNSEWSYIEWRTNLIQKMCIARLKCGIPFEEWFDSDWLQVVPYTTTVVKKHDISDDDDAKMGINECYRPLNEKNEVEIQMMLGKGGFGKVYVGTMDGTAVAVKIMVVEESRMEKAIKEANIGCHLRHPNIAQTLKYKISDTLSGTEQLKQLGLTPLCDRGDGLTRQDDDPLFEIWIIQELCTMDTLHSAIKKHFCFASSRFSKLEVIAMLTLDIVTALLYLNEHGIIHGDLSSSNVMLTEDASMPLGFRAKLIDFGRARLCQSDKAKTDTLGTIVSMAPETVLSGELNVKSDMYSLGIILIELWSGTIPWSGRLTVQILFAVSQGKEVEFPADAPLQLKELGWKCLARHPDQRPSPQDVKDMCIAMIDSDIALRHCHAV